LWNQHPEPTGSRWATPTSSKIQQNPGHPHRKQRQTYQPQTIIAPHIGNLFGSLLTPFVEVNRFWLELLRSSSLLRWIEQQTPTYCSPPAQLYKPGIPSELYWRVQM